MEIKLFVSNVRSTFPVPDLEFRYTYDFVYRPTHRQRSSPGYFFSRNINRRSLTIHGYICIYIYLYTYVYGDRLSVSIVDPWRNIIYIINRSGDASLCRYKQDWRVVSVHRVGRSRVIMISLLKVYRVNGLSGRTGALSSVYPCLIVERAHAKTNEQRRNENYQAWSSFVRVLRIRNVNNDASS